MALKTAFETAFKTALKQPLKKDRNPLKKAFPVRSTMESLQAVMCPGIGSLGIRFGFLAIFLSFLRGSYTFLMAFLRDSYPF